MIPAPIIILGGQGMLGQDLARVFGDKRTFVWDRNDLDITDEQAVKEKLEYFKPRVVINAAAFNFVDDIEKEEVYPIAHKVNALGPKYLAEQCAAIDATFIHYSTDYVFDGTNKDGYTEDATPNPQSKYAQTKYDGEKNVIVAGGKSYIIRTSRLFGAPGATDGSKKSFVDLMIDLASTRDHLDIVNEEYSSPTYTADLAAQTRILIDDSNGYAPGIYHVTNSGACTWYEFAQHIFATAGITIDTTAVPASAFPRPAARPAYSALLNTKLPPMRSWQEAVSAYIQKKSS